MAATRRLVMVAIAGLSAAACSSGHSNATPSTRPVRPTTTTATATTTSAPHPTTTGKPKPGRPPIECVAALPLRVRVGQMLMFAVDGSHLAASQSTFADLDLGGALLQTPGASITHDQVVAFRDAGSIPMFIAVDEEGGDVQRLAARFGAIPSADTVARTMSAPAAQAMIAAHARLVAGLGVNVAFAPVVDVRPVGRQGPIGNRSFSDDPAIVTRYATAYVAGWRAAGVMPVLKHFPGHGSASGDTHQGVATVPPLSQLRQRDLVPYVALARGASNIGVMVAHVEVPGFTNGASSLSPAAYDLLRHEIGFRGVAFTDALNMGAISSGYSVTQAAVAALHAGADVALLTDLPDAGSVVAAVTAAVGSRIPAAQVDASVLRILEAKKVDPCSLRL